MSTNLKGLLSMSTDSIDTNNEYRSVADPRRLAHLYNERSQSLHPIEQTFSSMISSMPDEVRQRVFINRRIQQVHNQFAQVVDPFILDHTNSVYLLRHKDEEERNVFDLVVYVDNSLCSAELNAQRELIRLKYRELFNLIIDVFEIRISRGAYKDSYPFRGRTENQQDQNQERELSPEEIEAIDNTVSILPQGKMKDSFIHAMKAQKRFNS